MNKIKAPSPYFWMILGAISLAGLWQLLSLFSSPVLVPSLGETLTALWNLPGAPAARADFYHTFSRLLAALVLLTITGIGVGILAGFNPWLEQLIKPVIDLLMAIPPVALTLMVIFLFGGGGLQTLVIAVALGFPLLYGGSLAAVRAVDRGLVEMLGAFKVPKAIRLREGYLPAVIAAVLPNLLLASGLTVRLMIMAEIIVGLDSGIGNALSLARVQMATADIFAWMLVMAACVLIIEGGLFYLVKKRLLRHQAGGIP
jgi:NitT/TauT family transport system permease protein